MRGENVSKTQCPEVKHARILLEFVAPVRPKVVRKSSRRFLGGRSFRVRVTTESVCFSPQGQTVEAWAFRVCVATAFENFMGLKPVGFCRTYVVAGSHDLQGF